jgi:mono/diheme cytochrome c family protein
MSSCKTTRSVFGLMLSALLTLVNCAAAAAEPEADESSTWLRGWTTLRHFDCARCHGRDWDGWSAPNLIAAVRDGSRERFERYVLVGDIGRGMPGYQSQPKLVAEIDSIYAYLLARAEGRMAAGIPTKVIQSLSASQ